MTPRVDSLFSPRGGACLAGGPGRPRVLIVARDAERGAIRPLLAEQLPDWEAAEADGGDRARFVQQWDPCTVVVLDEGAAREAGALEWLRAVRPAPLLFLTEDRDLICAAVERGATHCLPRGLALGRPGLLASVLSRAAAAGEARGRLHAADEALADCRRRVRRLLSRLWEAAPTASGAGWFTQRHMMERLHEEAARAQRYGGPLTVVLGELQPGEGGAAEAEADGLTGWAAEQLNRCKRRSDLAGQYGPHGFMLLLPRTAEPGALGCCRRLGSLLERPPGGPRGPLRVCFGAASVEGEEAGAVPRLLCRAEERLDEAKAGRCR